MLSQFKTWLFRVKRVSLVGAQPLKDPSHLLMGVGNYLGASGTSINRTDTLRGRPGPFGRLAHGDSTQRINFIQEMHISSFCR